MVIIIKYKLCTKDMNKQKKHNDKLFDNDGPYSKTYNYVFEKQALII